jgi:hypothetical protein
MIATGIMCEMMLSNIPPQNFHFHLLHKEGGDAVPIKMWFSRQRRLEIYMDGPATVDVKTRPVVVLKMGVIVPIENFFEANVVGKLASLLGIDPANIRVTFRMRASVGILSRNELKGLLF